MDYLGDNPYWLLSALLGLGLAVWSFRGGGRRARYLGLALLGLAAVLAFTSYVPLTDAQKVGRLTRQLVRAVQQRDTATLDALLDDQATLRSLDKADMLDTIPRTVEGARISSARVTSIQITRVAGLQSVELTVVTHHDPGGLFEGDTFISTWRLDWIKRPTGWRVIEIVPLQLMNQDASSLDQYLGRPR